MPKQCNSQFAYNLFYWLSVSSIALNPFIYFYFDSKFRSTARCFCCCLFLRYSGGKWHFKRRPPSLVVGELTRARCLSEASTSNAPPACSWRGGGGGRQWPCWWWWWWWSPSQEMSQLRHRHRLFCQCVWSHKIQVLRFDKRITLNIQNIKYLLVRTAELLWDGNGNIYWGWFVFLYYNCSSIFHRLQLICIMWYKKRSDRSTNGTVGKVVVRLKWWQCSNEANKRHQI